MKKTACASALLIGILLLSACSTISGQQAQEKAVEFVEANVKFFAMNNDSAVEFSQFDITDIKSTYLDSKWKVTMHVAASSGNETKQSDVSVLMDKKGDVLELNGKPVPRR